MKRYALGFKRLAVLAAVCSLGLILAAAPPAQALPHFIEVIHNDGNGKCLDVRTQDNYLLQLWDCTGHTEQQWIYSDPVSIDGTLYIQLTNWHTGTCLEPAGGSRDAAVPIVVNPCNSADSQLWQPVWAGSQQTRALINKNSGLCFDLRGNFSANATIIHQWWCNGTSAQVWRIDRGWF